MEIRFTHHFRQRKIERDDYLVPTSGFPELRTEIPMVEKIMRKKGNWFVNYDTKDSIPRIYCIVNNLEVYCGLIVDTDFGNEIVITTYYPYSKKMWKRLYPKGKSNFEKMAMKAAY